MHVVANLDLVVELDAILNEGVFHGAAINRRIGTNFNIIANDNPAVLGNFYPRTVFLLGKAEAVGADHCAGMNDGAPAN